LNAILVAQSSLCKPATPLVAAPELCKPGVCVRVWLAIASPIVALLPVAVALVLVLAGALMVLNAVLLLMLVGIDAFTSAPQTPIHAPIELLAP
jgi:hypothetical protein